MIGIPLGLLYANAVEWAAHKYLLHGLGKKKGSMWNFHWGEHHKHCRKHGFRDPDYDRVNWAKHAQSKEALAVVAAVAAHLPLFPVAPFFTATVCYAGANYLHIHRKAHLDPQWAREHLTIHYDHHMGNNQDANWCVTRPWFDWIMGTRVPYAFTEAEKRRWAKLNAGRVLKAAPANDTAGGAMTAA